MSPLRIPAFRNLWLGQAISSLGDAFYFVIFAFMTMKITGSEAMVGFVCALETLPYLLLSPYAGVVADRIDRRRIMLLSDCCSAGLLIAFAIVIYSTNGHPPAWTLMLAASSLATMRVFFMPARGAAVPALVPEDMLMKANAFSSATQNIMPLISLSISASVLAILYAISPTLFFLSAVLLNMLSFLGSAIFVAKLPPVLPDRVAAEEKHPLTDLREGVAYVRGRRELAVMLAIQLVMNLMISPFFVVYLVANKLWFNDLPQNLAWLECSFFAGLVASSLIVGRLKIKRVGYGYVASVILVGLAVSLMGYTKNFWLFVSLNVIAGLSVPFGNIPVNTYLQLTVPDAYRGRVNSAWTMASIGIQPIGLSLGGVLVQRAGLVGSFLVMGLGMALAGSLGLLDSGVRRLRTPQERATGGELLVSELVS